MGVRGLTSFIAKRADLYLTPYELHDCNLVIDGDNLACNLYKDVSGICSAFGGDYDDFYRAVVNFFAVLAECKVKAYVLMDGGYEHRKLRTVGKRMRGKIAVLKRINPCASINVFPLMMKEVFVDAVKDCGIPVMRCIFEADDELAALSRKLKCPVLSYDSDFYIHNVKYIPLITLTVKAHTKVCTNIDVESRKLRQNEARKVFKRTMKNRIMDTIVVGNNEKRIKRNTYKYLDCCMYRIENLLARGSLSKEKLPLFAAMLGNDYISRSSFRNFFHSGMGKVGRSRKTKQQQRRIKVILQWLKTQTAESAMEKIITRLQANQRESLMSQVQAATSGYSNEKCRSYDYFKSYEDFMVSDDEEIDDTDEEGEALRTDEEEDQSENDESEEDYEEEEKDQSENDEEDYEEGEEGDEEKCDEPAACFIIKKDKSVELENDPEQKDNNLKMRYNSISEISEELEEEDEESREDTNDVISSFPKWFKDKLYPANLPRFFVDLIYLRKYINNPQIEHFDFNDCNAIALPILTLIYSLLNNVKDEEYVPKQTKAGIMQPLYFTYLTRATGKTKLCYTHVEVEEKPKYDFVPESPNPLFLKTLFENNMPELNSDELFKELDTLPTDMKLYFLAIVFWLQRCELYDIVHLHALLVCLVVLKVIDSKITPERDLKAFQKKFGKIIKKERQIRDKNAASGTKRTISDQVRALPVLERLAYIPKSDCFLVQNELLKHFHMQEIFKKKYDGYSSIVLHAFAEFQSVVFQLHSLNALLDFPYSPPRMGQSYCGVFLYNLYDLLKCRLDIEYYVKNFIFRDSQMMFDLYSYLWEWCEKFIPFRKKPKDHNINPTLSKKILKKKLQQARKNDGKENVIKDPNDDMLSSGAEINDDEFLDLNNKFCTLLKVSNSIRS